MKRIKPLVLLLVFLQASITWAGAKSGDGELDWREEYAYNTGKQAFVFSYPWLYMSQLRYAWVTQPRNPELIPYMAINTFWHLRNVGTPEYQDGGSPNTDTLYSLSWMDVEDEPYILSHPDMGDRYFEFQLASMSSDNIGYVSSRATGSGPGSFLIAGPDYKGELPPGVRSIAPGNGTMEQAATMPFLASHNNTVYIQARTAVSGIEDARVVNRLQDQYTLTPLSQWGKTPVKMPENRDVWKPADSKNDPLGEWKTINRAMTENPPIAQHQAIVNSYKRVGIGPGQDVEKMDAATKRGLVRAAKDARALMQRVMFAGGYGKLVNGWHIHPGTIGSAGYYDDFLTRGAIQSMQGLIFNDPVEAVYPATYVDVNGKPLDGKNNYQLTFGPGQLPEAEYFWSLTMYDQNNNLVKNPIERQAIGSNQGGYKLEADGSLPIYIQHESPGTDKQANWLPAPAGPFHVVLRIYGPGQAEVEGSYEPPGILLIR